jgi:hypothetical protein
MGWASEPESRGRLRRRRAASWLVSLAILTLFATTSAAAETKRVLLMSSTDSLLPAGEATIEVDFAYAGAEGEVGKGATVTLKVNGEQVAKGTMEATVPGALRRRYLRHRPGHRPARRVRIRAAVPLHGHDKSGHGEGFRLMAFAGEG